MMQIFLKHNLSLGAFSLQLTYINLYVTIQIYVVMHEPRRMRGVVSIRYINQSLALNKAKQNELVNRWLNKRTNNFDIFLRAFTRNTVFT